MRLLFISTDDGKKLSLPTVEAIEVEQRSAGTETALRVPVAAVRRAGMAIGTEGVVEMEVVTEGVSRVKVTGGTVSGGNICPLCSEAGTGAFGSLLMMLLLLLLTAF